MIGKWLSVVGVFAPLFGGVAAAQEDVSLVVPVRVVDGHLMVIGSLTNGAGDLSDVSLEVSFEDPGTLTLDGDEYDWLGNPAIVRLMLKPDIQLMFTPAEVKAETRDARSAMHDELTRLSSSKLDDHKAKGILGIGFLRKYHVALDIADGRMTLSPPGPRTSAKGEVSQAFTLQNGKVTIPIDYADGRTGQLALGGDAYDTYIYDVTAEALGKPAGDISPLWLGPAGGIDLSAQMALRPGRTGGATVVAGVNLFEAFRIEVDWAQSKVAFTRTTRPSYPLADFAYFQAEVGSTPEALQLYLEEYPAARFSAEAAQRLMELRLKDTSRSDEDFMRALQWTAETSPPERKMENCAAVVRRFRALPERDALVAQAGTYALQFSRTAVTVQDIYRLHNIIGEAYLNQNKVKEAWKHFLSAAFTPLDDKTDLIHNIEVNLNLARAYDRMGRVSRAYSRYVRAQEMLAPLEKKVESIPDDTSKMSPEAQRRSKVLKAAIPEVKAALERLKKRIPADELEMLEG